MTSVPMLRIYPATKLSNIDTIRLWQEWYPKELFFHARWLRHVEMGTPDIPENAEEFWLEDEEDIKSADAVVVFAKPEQHLRGALVECGIALANDIPLFVIGNHPDYGTWQYHPGVTRVADIADVARRAHFIAAKRRGL